MLKSRKEIHVRFNEVDSLHIVWHGHYINYFEDGREAFGQEFGLSYMDVFNEGYRIPLVHIDCQFKRPIAYGDRVEVITTFVDTPAAKIIYKFEIRNTKTNELLATGRSEQVFVDSRNELYLVNPEFYISWKKKMGLL